jgi:hypothetical protein
MFSFTVRRLIGATAVVCLAASAVVVGSVAVPARTLALPGASESTVVTIEPTRVADTRYNIGLTSKVLANAKAPRKFTVTGPINTYIESTETTVVKQVVPAGATGVFLNVTVVNPSEPGFLAIRPGTATGVPATGGLNFDLDTVLANGILVALPTTGNNAGQIDLYYGSPTADASTDLIFDVVGYTTSSGLINLTKRLETLEASGVQGPAGAPGPTGAAGAPGSPARVIWVADDTTGNYSKLSEALAAIGTTLPAATAAKPYVIKIAPGTYTELESVALESFVDVEGSGQGITIIKCACGSSTNPAESAAVSAGAITAEIRHLTINNNISSGKSYGSGVYTSGVTNGSFSMNNLTATATATGGTYGVRGVYNESSSPSMNNVTATATSTSTDYGSYGVHNEGTSSPTMNNVTTTATGGGTVNSGVYNEGTSSPTIRNSSITGASRSITNTVSTSASASANVANTFLNGSVEGENFECIFVYSPAFEETSASCLFPA